MAQAQEAAQVQEVDQAAAQVQRANQVLQTTAETADQVNLTRHLFREFSELLSRLLNL